jgi:hypothetical protein
VRIDPRELAEMIREGLLMVDLDLSVRFARCSFGAAFTVTPKDTPPDQEANNETQSNASVRSQSVSLEGKWRASRSRLSKG